MPRSVTNLTRLSPIGYSATASSSSILELPVKQLLVYLSKPACRANFTISLIYILSFMLDISFSIIVSVSQLCIFPMQPFKVEVD